MIGRTNTGGGVGVGGSHLVIVGGTICPAKAHHNMVWVKTDAEITGYVLSATAPTTPVEGMVWISISDSGDNVTIAPVGGDWVTIYPLSASQYVNGAWVAKVAKCYRDGQWYEWWDGMLYDTGNEFKSATGGWWQNPNLEHASGAKNTGTATKNAETLTISANSVTYCGALSTVKMVDLTNYKTLRIEGTGYCLCLAHTFTSGVLNGKASAQGSINGSGNVDISGLNGSYYITFSTYNGNTYTCKKITLMR